MNIEIHDKTKAESFCYIFQHAKVFADNINITFNDTKLYVQSMDSSHIVIFEIHLPREWFDVYEYNEDAGDTIIGISSSIFSKVLNTRDKSQKIKIEFIQEESDKIYVHHIGSNETTSLDKHFHLPLMDIESEMLAIPEFESDVTITIPSSSLSSIINQLNIFGDTMTFHCSGEGIRVVTESPETGKMEVDIVDTPETSCVTSEDIDMKVSYALYKMHDICSNTKLSKNAEVSISSCFPIRITYDIAGDGKMLFYLAPKVDE